ncbi:hypothetical protein DP68_06995 [Clostridium sp. HMP27]|nr:hypothetical protein DP68_06995 [Clostridium sp. HMP27]
MGTGKTSYAIQMMKEAPEIEKFIFITPFLAEVDRIREELPNRHFKTPSVKNKKGSKLEGLKQLLTNGDNIVSTHALFKRCDDEVRNLLKSNGYILILDECMDVVEQFDIVEEDIQILFKSQTILEDNKRWIRWVGTNKEYTGAFKDLMESCFNNNIYHYGERLYLWTFPVDIFDSFNKVYILTYMFDGQLQKYYFDIFNIKYEYKSVIKVEDKYKLTEYKKVLDMKAIENLLNIYEGKLNEIGNAEYTFSANNLKNLKKKPALIKLLKNNISNYFKHITNSKSSEIMWTTFKDMKSLLKGKGYTKGFVPCNSRATNEFKDRTTMAYIANRFTNPCVKQFFKANGVEINEDAIALSELVQWIFRSAIREGKEVNLYIPSRRMRTLLQNWLKGVSI